METAHWRAQNYFSGTSLILARLALKFNGSLDHLYNLNIYYNVHSRKHLRSALLRFYINVERKMDVESYIKLVEETYKETSNLWEQFGRGPIIIIEQTFNRLKLRMEVIRYLCHADHPKVYLDFEYQSEMLKGEPKRLLIVHKHWHLTFSAITLSFLNKGLWYITTAMYTSCRVLWYGMLLILHDLI